MAVRLTMTSSTVTCLTLACDLFIIGQGLCGEPTFWKFQSSIEDQIGGRGARFNRNKEKHVRTGMCMCKGLAV